METVEMEPVSEKVVTESQTVDAVPSGSPPALDVDRIRADFSVLSEKVRGKALVYLDNAATSQVPNTVGDAIHRFHHTYRSNIHRGVHFLSQESTRKYEATREVVRAFLGARSQKEIVFLRGTTEAVNLVAQSYGRPRFGPGDEVLITRMEHHSNIVPWQMVCEQTGATLRAVEIDERGDLRLDHLDELLSERTKLVAVTHVSNALGTVNPVKEIVARAHAVGAKVLIDGAQAVPHTAVDVADLDCDFYAFSGHKVFGPTGIGVLYGKEDLLNSMPPYHGGGDMILTVGLEKSTYRKSPGRFEAGTPNIAGTIGLAAALEYIQEIGLDRIAAYEHELLEYGTRVLSEVPGLRLIGTAREKASVLSFVLEGVHPHDLGTILDQEGVAIRAGHHCAQPVMDFFSVPATARASLAFYNTKDEIDALVKALHKAIEVFS